MNVPKDLGPVEANSQMGNSRFWWKKKSQWTSGDSRFDGYFACHCNDEERATRILSDPIRWQLMQILGLGILGLYFSVEQGTMVVAAKNYVTNKQRLDDFVRLTLEIYDQMMLAQAVGIDFVQDQTAIIDSVRCPICACDIEDKMVICVRCKTPHCLQCWKYNGKCATFACGETRYVYPVSEPTPNK